MSSSGSESLPDVVDLASGDHACSIYDTDEEHRIVSTRFVRQGLERNEKVLYVADARAPGDVLDCLRGGGLDPRPYLETGQLAILTVADAHLRDGAFVPDRMISMLRQECARALEEGYDGLRTTGEMSWALRRLPGADRLVEYESRLNDFFRGSRCVAICQYDRRLFSPELLLRVLAAHPVAVIGAEAFDNVHYIPPEAFLAQEFPAAVLGHWIARLRIRKRAKAEEEALRKDEELYRSTFVQAAVGVAHQAPDGRYLKVNAAYCEMLGYGQDEMLERTVQQSTHSDDLEAYLAGIRRVAAGEIATFSMEKRYVRKDGTPVWTLVNVAPVRDASREIAYFIVVARDISERKTLEEQLRQSQKIEAVGRLAGGVAHDFNNLLTAILGYCDLSLGRLDDSEQLKSDIMEIRRASDACASLTRQLLAFSRQQILQPSVLNLNTLVGELERMLRRLIGEDVELVSLLAEDLGNVKVDPGQIEQVITNLAVNARDAMPDGGTITIETANIDLDAGYAHKHVSVVPGPYVMIAVSDTGCGMSKETLARVFEPFFTTKPKGTGLGLSTVYGIVKQSGGYVYVYSEPDVGTTFQIYLPRAEGTPGERPKPPPPSVEELRGDETVLVVEDDDSVRQLVRRILGRYGYAVLEAARGEEAFDLCRRHRGPIHLMLTDVVMPGITGMTLSKELASVQPRMKVLFMSGYTAETIAHRGILDPGVAFIQKPFTMAALAGKVREVLDSETTRD